MTSVILDEGAIKFLIKGTKQAQEDNLRRIQCHENQIKISTNELEKAKESLATELKRKALHDERLKCLEKSLDCVLLITDPKEERFFESYDTRLHL
jgi:hypothetical protein